MPEKWRIEQLNDYSDKAFDNITHRVYIDEIGDLGIKWKKVDDTTYRPSLIFGMGSTDTKSDYGLRKVWTNLLGRHGNPREKKARDLKMEELLDTSNELNKHGEHNAFVIRKDGDLPDGWVDGGASGRMIGLLQYVIDWYLQHNQIDEIAFIIDIHDVYLYNGQTVLNSIKQLEITHGGKVHYRFMKSFDLGLQANDPVPYSIYLKEEKKEKQLMDVLQVREFILASDKSIKVRAHETDLVEEGVISKSRKKKDTAWEPKRPKGRVITQIVRGL